MDALSTWIAGEADFDAGVFRTVLRVDGGG